MNWKKGLALVALAILGFYFFGSEDPPPPTGQEEGSSQEIPVVEEKDATKPQRPALKPDRTRPQGSELTGVEQLKQQLERETEDLKGKLEQCRKQIKELVREEDIQELEASVWDLEGEKLTEQQRSALESNLMAKVSTIQSVNWHLEEVAQLNRKIMAPEVAQADPEWTIKMGSQIRPCGLYNTHRLYALWIELLPKLGPGAGVNREVEQQLVGYVRQMLDYSMGTAGVAMYVELLAALSAKGYFDPQMREQIRYIERRLNEEMDVRYEGVDSSSQDLVNAIVRDFKDTEMAKGEVRDLLGQFYPQ